MSFLRIIDKSIIFPSYACSSSLDKIVNLLTKSIREKDRKSTN